MHAIKKHQSTVVELLLEKGALPDLKDTKGQSSIMYAIKENDRIILLPVLA